MTRLLLPLLVALTILPAAAQPALPDSLTETEQAILEILKEDGIHVVHFWAPWCPNSINELRHGWYELIEKNPEVNFLFVTVWNDAQSGRDAMQQYAIPDSVREFVQPDFGTYRVRANRRMEFLGLPLTWIPSTWIYRRNGQLAFAMNYGEMRMETLQYLIDAAQGRW